MPIITLKFKLPEEQGEYDCVLNASNYYGALWDLYQFLRADSKHGEGKWADVYEEFWVILKKNDVDDI